MAGIGLGLKGGYIFYGKTQYQYKSPVSALAAAYRPIEQPSRGAPAVMANLYLGDGFGLAFDIEGYMAFEDQITFGGYLGPAFRFHIKRMYFSIGAGLRVGYLRDRTLPNGELLTQGLDLYGRFPLTLTYYVADGLGLVFEFGFGWGGTGAKFGNVSPDPALLGGLPPDLVMQAAAQADSVGFQFAGTGTFDGSIGLRFP